MGAHSSRYIVGQKRYQVCQLFLFYEGIYCPCCNFRLRLKPRLGTAGEKLRLALKP
jgi:hypothetical protein